MENSLQVNLKENELINSAEPEKHLEQLAKINIPNYLREQGINNLCNAKDIILVIEKLCLLKNIELDTFQSISLVNEILIHELTRLDLINRFENILSLSLWNNQLNIDHFIKETSNIIQFNIAVSILTKWIVDVKKNSREYESTVYPQQIIDEFVYEENKLENLKSLMISDFKDKLNSAIKIDLESLENYFPNGEIDQYKSFLKKIKIINKVD